MSQPHDPHRTVDESSVPADSLDAGLAAGFGRPGVPRSSLDASQRPVMLREAEGESAHIVKPKSDAMPSKEATGDRYHLSGEIARGGMGAVLRGRDVDLGRDLAVKVLLEKYANRPEVARRFIEEAQIGGQLQHPGVVPVYDIGRFGDRPFFTMKLVKGLTLAAILGERIDPAADRPRLLGIALQVAQAMAYAHAKGVIHRDLKPANVMVGAFGEVQVMDWGLAKVLAEGGVADEERAASRGRERPEVGTVIRTARSAGSKGSFGTDTEAGSLLGTPAYMPPEQATGDVANLDRRADVFGLGAILCEVLTGKPAYVGRSAEEVRRKAANGDLADAVARLDGCGADAELVALTKACLAPEAIDRPRDAQAVADALKAYEEGVRARLHRAELAEAAATARAAEEAKRLRLTLALAATVLLAVTLGGGGWLWVKADRDARQAQVSREITDALYKASALYEQARAAKVGGAALFAQAREQAQRALALVTSGPADEGLKAQVRQLQTELDEEEKDLALLAALDAAQLAQAETVLGEKPFAAERALPKLREAFRAYGLPVGEVEPAMAAGLIRQRPAALREAIVAGLDEWYILSPVPENKAHKAWLWAVLEATEPDDAWSRQVRLARRVTDRAKRQAALSALAKSAKVAELPARALTRLAWHLRPPQAAELLRRAQQHYPADFWVNHNLGIALREATPPEWDEAVRFLTAAVALRPTSQACLNNLGNTLHRKGRIDEAIACCRKALELDPMYAGIHVNLGAALRAKGQLDEAIASYRKALELDPKFPLAHDSLGTLLKENGQFDEAVVSRRRATQVDPKNAEAHYRLGNSLKDSGRVDEAISSYRKALELDPRYAKAHTNLGAALYAKDQLDEAISSFRKAIEFDPKNATTHSNLGAALHDKGRLDEAIASHRRAIEVDPKYVGAYNNLGVALKDKGRVDEAIASYRKALELDPKYAAAHTNLGTALKDKGQLDEAIASHRRAIEVDPKNATAHCNLGDDLKLKGRIDEAIASYRKAIELDPNYAAAHCNLGHALRDRGRFADSLAALRRGHELGTKQPDWTYPSAGWVRQAERLAVLEGKLPAFLKGEFRPRDTSERLGLADVCGAKRLHHTATRLFADAFAADPKLADDLKEQYRYNAACFASLAAAGQGEDVAQLDDKERTRLRKQAVDWLRADLGLRTKQLKSGQPADRTAAQQALRHWQQDNDLAGLRDKAALAKLPAEDRTACEKLWAEVAALLK